MAPKRTREERDPDRVVLRDPAAIKALAHPARLVILDELMDQGDQGGQPDQAERTATEIAEVAGISPSAMSYHLRQLARWQIVVEVESADGRERRWKINPGGFAISPDQPRASIAAETTLVTRMLDRGREDVLRWFAQEESEPDDWRDAATLTRSFMWLTVEELEHINEMVEELVDGFRDRKDPARRPAGARRVEITYTAIPAIPRPARKRS